MQNIKSHNEDNNRAVRETIHRQQGMNPEDYSWYLALRKYGGTTHSGFGLGFERMVMYLTGVSNIRDVVPYPRTFGDLKF